MFFITRKSGVRILSLDGGGSRGLVLAMTIQSLEEKLNNKVFHNGGEGNVRLWQLYDLIVGMSI